MHGLIWGGSAEAVAAGAAIGLMIGDTRYADPYGYHNGVKYVPRRRPYGPHGPRLYVPKRDQRRETGDE